MLHKLDGLELRHMGQRNGSRKDDDDDDDGNNKCCFLLFVIVGHRCCPVAVLSLLLPLLLPLPLLVLLLSLSLVANFQAHFAHTRNLRLARPREREGENHWMMRKVRNRVGVLCVCVLVGPRAR